MGIPLAFHLSSYDSGSAYVFKMRPCEAIIDWLKFNLFKLNAIVDRPKAVSQMHTTGQSAKQKCKAFELLNEAY